MHRSAPRPPVRTGELSAAHRPRVAAILRATGVFSAAEMAVALELFDEAFSIADCGLRIDDPGQATARGVGPDAGTVPQSAIRNVVAPPPSTGSDYCFLGAFTPEDELVGYACYGPTPATDRTFDLYWIAVEPATHGAGIGTILLTEVERRLQGQHARMLVVETSSRSDYAPTRGFYGRRGYGEAARVRDFYAPGDDRIIFTKRFHPPTGRAHSPTGRGAVSP